LRIDGDPRQGEPFEVSTCGAFADLELLSQLGRGDPTLGLQDQ